MTSSYKKLIIADEIANVNFVYDDIVHALENTIDSCINFLQRRFTKFSEITECNSHYAFQGHSRSADGQCTKWRRNTAENFNRPSRVHERYRPQTTGDRRTDDDI